MKHTAAVLSATVATVALSFVSTATAYAGGDAGDMGCGGGYVAPALSTHLQYRSAHWDASGGTLGISAPQGWSFVRTPRGEGRFHSRSGIDLLSLGPVAGSGTTAEQMAAQLRELAGTAGLKVIGQHTQVVGGRTWSTLSYHYLTSMSEPRAVKVRWIADGGTSADASAVLTVAGRPFDGKGMDALLAHVTPTVALAG
jgi:hypothetical protein